MREKTIEELMEILSGKLKKHISFLIIEAIF